MNPDTQSRLFDIFMEVEDEFADKSIEFCLEVAAERARVTGVKPDCDCCDIAEAITM